MKKLCPPLKNILRIGIRIKKNIFENGYMLYIFELKYGNIIIGEKLKQKIM